MKYRLKTLVLFLAILHSKGFCQNNSMTSAVVNEAWGVSFEPPLGWNTKFDDGRYLITGTDENELVLVFRHTLKSRQELVSDFENWTEGDLTPATPLYNDIDDSSIGYYIQGTYNKISVYGYLIAIVNPYGKGVTVMMLVSNNLFADKHVELAAKVASTIIFTAPKMNQASGFTQWDEKLSGKLLHYMESYSSSSPGGGGYSRERKISLYPDHSCTFSWISTIYGPANTGSQDSGQGNWRITTSESGKPMLELQLNDGKNLNYVITESSEGLFLNGERHYREDLQ